MCPAIKNSAMVHDDDLIGFENGGEAMGNRDDSFPFRERVNGLLDDFLALGIKGGSRFVKK